MCRMMRWALTTSILLSSLLSPWLAEVSSAALGTSPAPATASSETWSPSPSPCTSGDGNVSIMFLVDQSASMGGTTIGGRTIPPSDPTEQRRQAPVFALTRLGEERMFSPAHPVNAVGVIGFGGRVSVDLPLSAISPDPKNLESWRAEQEGLASQIKASDLGDTDFLPPFEEAARQFENQDRSCPGQTGQRALILVTDGGPSVSRLGANPVEPYWPGDREYMRTLKERVSQLFNRDRYRLWVLTLTRPGAIDMERVRPDWEELASNYGGSVIGLSDNVADVSAKVEGVLKSLGFGANEIQCGPSYVDPYTSHLSIWFLKPASATGVNVTLPDGSQLRDGDSRIIFRTSSGTNEEMVVRAPPPGQWIYSGCSAVRIYVVPFRAVARFKSPTQVVASGDDRAVLQYTLTDANGEAVPLNPSYPLDWKVRINGPSGPVTPSWKSQAAKSDGVYEFAPLPVGQPGTYKVEVEATTKRADPYNSSPLIVAQDKGASYVVGAAAPTVAPPTAPPTATPIVSPPRPPQPPEPPNPVVLGILGLVAVAALVGAIVWIITGQGPKGTLEFRGALYDELRGTLVMKGRPRKISLNQQQCDARFPGVGLQTLMVKPGAMAGGRTTVEFSLKATDGNESSGRLYDADVAYVDGRSEVKMVYRAKAVKAQPVQPEAEF